MTKAPSPRAPGGRGPGQLARGWSTAALAWTLGGCAAGLPGLAPPPCVEDGPAQILPEVVRESSGVVRAGPVNRQQQGGASTPGVGSVRDGAGAEGVEPTIWTHNDSGWPAEIFRLSLSGELLQRVRVGPDAWNVDWEDLAAGPCPGPEARAGTSLGMDGDRSTHEASGEGRPRCLYLADTGDNRESRTEVAVVRVQEPALVPTTREVARAEEDRGAPGDAQDSDGRVASDAGPGELAEAVRIPIRLPYGPRDIEAMVVLPGEHLLLVTKGRNHPIEVYRVPGPLPLDRPAQAERIQLLTRERPGVRGWVTGAAAHQRDSGEWVMALRTYQSLSFFRVDRAEGAPVGIVPLPGARVNLLSLREPQGEAVGFLDDDRLVLASEGGLHGGPASLRILHCGEGWKRWLP